MSDSTLREVDTEVRKLIEKSYAQAKKLLEDNVDILHSMAEALMKHETIDAMQVDDLMARREVREPGDYGDSYKPKDAKVIEPEAKKENSKVEPIKAETQEEKSSQDSDKTE